MNRTIKTYNDLCIERDRLRSLQVVQRDRVKADWDTLKHEFDSVKHAVGFVGKLTHPDKQNPLLNKGIKMATELFITRFVLGKADWVTRLAVPFVVRNYSSHLLAEKGKNIVAKVGGLFRKRRSANDGLPNTTSNNTFES